MANFRTQIENLAGKSTFSTTAEETEYTDMLNNFLLQSARNVLDVLSDEQIKQNTIVLEISDHAGASVTNVKISKVLRNGIGCVEVPLEMKAKVSASSNSIYAPTESSPVYYIEGQTATGAKLFVKPDPTNTIKAQLYFIGIPTSILNTATTIANFPDQAEYAVILGSAVRLVQHKMNTLLHEDEDVELAQVVQGELQVLNQMYMVELSQLTDMPIQQSQEVE